MGISRCRPRVILVVAQDGSPIPAGTLDFAPFGGGYRRCAGAAFATFELQVLTAAIVRRLDFSLDPSLRVERVQYGPFPGPSGRIPIQLDEVGERPASR